MLRISKQIMLEPGSWDHKAAQYLLRHFEEYLKLGNIQNYSVGKATIEFSGPAYRWAWNGFHFLNFVSRTEFSYFEKNKLHFVKITMQYSELVMIALALSLGTIPAFLLGFYGYGLLVLAALWVLFVGGTIGISWLRFNWWLDEQQKLYRTKQTKEIIAKLAR
jgi:hypothetical protein